MTMVRQSQKQNANKPRKVRTPHVQPSQTRSKAKVRTPTVGKPSPTVGKANTGSNDFWKNYPLPQFQMAGPPPERDALATWCHDLCTQVQILYGAVHGQRAIVQAEWARASAAQEKAEAILATVQDMFCKVLDVISVRQAKSIGAHNAVVLSLAKLIHLHNHNAGTSKSPDRCKHIKFTPKDIRDIMKLQVDSEPSILKNKNAAAKPAAKRTKS